MTVMQLIALTTDLYRRLSATDEGTRSDIIGHWQEIKRTGVVPLGWRKPIGSDRWVYKVVVISKGEFDGDSSQYEYIRGMRPIGGELRILRL